MRIILAAILGFGLGLALTAQANASCECRCVDGHMHALCSSPIDIAPICPLTICQIPPLGVAPIKPLRLPPLGAMQCAQRQVLNPTTSQYEWHRLCQ